MIETEEASSREAPPVRTSLYAARQGACLAAAAVDEATDAVCRASSGSAPRLEEVMNAAHKEAGDAERYAAWAEGWESEGVSERVLAKYASMAVGAALRAQVAAGVETSERESAARREEAREEEAARAATGMDRENRELEDGNRFFAEMSVAELGWTAGHVRVLEAGASGRLYWRGGQARQASRDGVREGGRRVSRERTKALYAARFLTGTRHDDGSRVLTLSPMGQIALRLAQLHPAGLYPDDRAAYEARHAAAARRWMSSDEKKAAARLVPLDSVAMRAYRRPVTLAEQQERARIEEADRWEDEGGSCPGVEAPRPRPEAEVAIGPEVEADPPGSTRRSVPEGRVGPRTLSGPRTGLEAPARSGTQPACPQPRPVAAAAGRRARSAPRSDRMQLALF